MNIVLFFFLAFIIVFASIKMSISVDNISKFNKGKGYLITGILLAGVTSLPELVTSITAVEMGNPYLAIGDIFGSNAFNIFIMCLIDLIFIKCYMFNNISGNYYEEYIVLTINYLVILFFVIFDNGLSFIGIGIPTLFFIAGYLLYIKKISKNSKENNDVKKINIKQEVIKILVCAVFMIVCSIFLTKIVNEISLKYPFISGSVFGAICLGITTSLPEVITFITLIKLKNYDMALTDILGSNIFNCFVLGLNDFFLQNRSIYLYTDLEGLTLLKIALVVNIISFIQVIRKKINNKFVYIIPTLFVIAIYIYFWICGFNK